MSDIWAQIIQQLHPLGTKALMGQQGQLLEFDGVEARVGIRSQQLMRMAHERLSNLEAAFAKVFGHTVKVALEVMAEPTAASRDTSPVPSPPPIVSPSEPASSPGPLPGPAAGLPEPMMVQAPEAEPSTCLAPPEPSQQPSWDVESDFERSVKSFAQFFNGQIVNFDAEDLPEPGRPPNPRPPRTPQSSQPGPDVPF
jgi:DNA polymerase-3 subunit gamma/tau